jgi:ribonuclease HI
VNGGVLSINIIGKQKINHLVIFTVARYNQFNSGIMIALDKKTGKEVWTWPMDHYAWSSSVDLYDQDGKAYLIQCDSMGNMFLVDGTSGQELDKINLGANVESSPCLLEYNCCRHKKQTLYTEVSYLIKVYIDGASAGNPGPSGVGIYIKVGNGNVERYSIPLAEMSNHEAEWISLIKALEICLEKGYLVVSFHTDSQLVEHAMEKRHVKNALYEPLLQQALDLIEQMELFFIKWIPSKENHVADELARKAIRS